MKTLIEMRDAVTLGNGTCQGCGVDIEIGLLCATCAPEFRLNVSKRDGKWLVSQSFAGINMRHVFETREQADTLIANQRATCAKYDRKFILDPNLERDQEHARLRLVEGAFGNGSSRIRPERGRRC